VGGTEVVWSAPARDQLARRSAPILQMDEDLWPRQDFGCSVARSVAEDDRVEQLTLWQGHRIIKDFPGMPALQSAGAMRKALVVAPLFGTFSR